MTTTATDSNVDGLDVMLDLETMGNGPHAAIMAIGAVCFDVRTGNTISRFYTLVDLASSMELGGVVDASTIVWWMKQSDEARGAFARVGNHLDAALVAFRNWLRQQGDVDQLRVWGNGAAFDNVILASAYRSVGLEVPWKFWNDRCYRTLKALVPGVKMQRHGTAHNALDDAESQRAHLLEILAALGLRTEG